ncbi:MAG: hypothetical protein LUE29_13805 [Lachnospiraceae bacterium]|nr:hypothetical protein [Lachnospiraceae bacterium]
MKEKKTIIRKIVFLFAALLAVFALINLVWYFGLKIRYVHLTEKVDRTEREESEVDQGLSRYIYESVRNGYCFTVKDTGYLSKSGYATVSREEGYERIVDADGNEISDNGPYVILFIWPSWFSGYTFGVDIESKDYWHQMKVDENGQLMEESDMDPDLQDELNAVLEENREEIERLFELADEMWDIR